MTVGMSRHCVQGLSGDDNEQVFKADTYMPANGAIQQ
jgi:hypothetical protein